MPSSWKKSRIALLVVALALFDQPVHASFPPGDLNGDSKVTLSDVLILAYHVLKHQLYPITLPECAGDVNSSCRVDIVDVVYVVNFVVKSGPQPKATICGWNLPTNLGPPINTPYNEDEPHLNLDLTIIYYTSDRPDGMGGWDIWHSQKGGSSWGTPANAGSNVNTTGNEISPSLSSNERKLYFCSDRSGGYGGYDIYFSSWDEESGVWLPAVNLGSNVNSAGDETGVFLTQDTLRIYFRSTGWGNTAGALYYSDWLGCEWGAPKDMGETVNGTGTENNPTTSPRGARLYFEKEGGVYFSRPGYSGYYNERTCNWGGPARFCMPSSQLDPDNMLSPYLGPDCDLIYFSSDRDAGQGLLDIWYSDSTYDIFLEGDCHLGGAFVDRDGEICPCESLIVFEGGSVWNEPRGIYLVNADGTGRRILYPGSSAWSPSWSPNGEWVVFSNNFKLYKIKPNGDSLVQLTFSGEAFYPDWSPDGQRIAYHDHLGSDAGIYLIDTDGGNKRFLVKSLYADWSKDGSRILNGGSEAIAMADTFGNLIDTLIFPGLDIEHPKWASDGTEIVFSFKDFNKNELVRQVGIVNYDGTNFRQLTRGGGDWPSPAPDGNKILFTDGRVLNGGIWIMDFDGCNQIEITRCK